MEERDGSVKVDNRADSSARINYTPLQSGVYGDWYRNMKDHSRRDRGHTPPYRRHRVNSGLWCPLIGGKSTFLGLREG